MNRIYDAERARGPAATARVRGLAAFHWRAAECLAFGTVCHGALLACTAGQDGLRNAASSPMASPDSGQKTERDAGRGVESLGVGADACSDTDSASLGMVPEILTVFDHATSSCQALGSGLLLQNTGATPLRIEGIQASTPEFALAGEALPVRLEAGQFFPLRVYYDGVLEGSIEAQLTVATSEGCRRFRLRGLRTSDTLLTRTAEALDFGRIDIGGVSRLQRLSVLTEQGTPPVAVRYSDFAVDPPDLFEIVSATAPDAVVAACETRNVDVRFRAPSTAGAYQGALLWRTTATAPEGDVEGTVLVPLYAAVGDSP